MSKFFTFSLLLVILGLVNLLSLEKAEKFETQENLKKLESLINSEKLKKIEEIEKIKNKHVDIFDQSMRIQLSKLPSNNESVKIGISLYKIFPEARDAKREKIYENSKKIFLNLYNERTARIPHISHRMWLTHSDSSEEAPLDRLKLYIKSLNELDPSQNWRHLFWCIDKNKIPNTIKFIKNSGIPIEIHETHEIYPKMRAKHLFDALYQEKLLTLAADIFKQNVVYLFGGIYADIGLMFHTDLTPYLDAYDYIFISSNEFIDQTFFGYKKHDPISNIFLNNLDSLYRLPKSVQQLQPAQPENVLLRWICAPHLTAVFDNYIQKSDRVLFLPIYKKTIIQENGLRSWKKGTHGNKKVSESQLNIFSILPKDK